MASASVVNDLYDYDGLKIYQYEDKFKFSLDSILLAEFVELKANTRVIVDFCTGNAPVPLILTTKTNSRIYGFEIQPNIAKLAKKLASSYKTRIELRQIGARDKARTICGIGQCGRPLCCSTFLNHIDSVTMNMAKNQGISLNPNKINGLCGRLLCCLTYEDDEYVRCGKGLPNVGQTVKTDFGKGKVISVDILNRKYKVDIDGTIKEIELGCGECERSK